MKSKYILGITLVVIVAILVIVLFQISRTSDQSLLQRFTMASLPGNQVAVGLVPEENIVLPAYYYASPGKVGNRGVVLLHGLGASHEVWNDYAAQLQANNFEVMTFDFRGHGEATGKWEEFSQDDIDKFTDDAREAIHYLRDVNKDMDIALIGSSIGANVAMEVAADDPTIKAVVLLSPAKEYHGISIVDDNAQFTRPALYGVSEADAGSFKDTQDLYESARSTKKELKTFPKSGHGHKLIANESDFAAYIITWLDAVL